MITPTTTTDRPLDTRTALLYAITSHPEEEDPRLRLADWYQENDEPERAELIRLHRLMSEIRRECWCGACVELRGGGQHHNGGCAIGKYRDYPGGANLRLRVRELQVALSSRLSAPCPGCGGSGFRPQADMQADAARLRVRDDIARIAAVKIHCETCGGTGDILKGDYREIGSPKPSIRTHTHHFDRGCLLLHVTLGGVAVEGDADCPSCFGVRRVAASEGDRQVCCPTCNGRGTVRGWQPTPWAAALPPEVVGLWVVCREPDHNGSGYCWFRASRSGQHTASETADLPDPVFDLLAGWEGAEQQSPSGRWRPYSTPDLARLHLAHALRRWCYGTQAAAGR